MAVINTDVIDPHNPDWYLAPDHYEVLARLRAETPVFGYKPSHYVVSRYDDIRAISRDPDHFVNGRGVLVNDPMRSTNAPPVAPSILHMDPPEHSQYRQLVSRAFTPRAVRSLEDRVRALARLTLDRIDLGADVDVVADIAVPLPVTVIAELLGIPEDVHDDFRRWSDAAILAGESDPRAMPGIGELFEYIGTHIDNTRTRGGDHLVARLVEADLDGYRLTRAELQMFCVVLLVAGNETTRHLISGGIRALAQHPDQLAALRAQPDLIPGAVEEMLRWTTPIQAFARTAARDLTLHDQPVREGDYLIMLYASGNRDESAFGPAAGEFNALRPADPAHVAFGFGQHLCLGASLARIEARVLFEELLARVDGVALAGAGRPTRSTIMHGWIELPVRFSPAA